jgi:hypothetical protein
MNAKGRLPAALHKNSTGSVADDRVFASAEAALVALCADIRALVDERTGAGAGGRETCA